MRKHILFVCVLALAFMGCDWLTGTTKLVKPDDIWTVIFESTDISDRKYTDGDLMTLPGYEIDGYFLNGWYLDGAFIGDSGDTYLVKRNLTLTPCFRSFLPMDNGDIVINGIVFVRVEKGAFTMGSPGSEEGRKFDERQYEVVLSEDYLVSKYPITNRQYARRIPEKPFPAGHEDHPVVHVSWYEATAFAKSVGGKLLTEAQWEWAARGGVLSNGYLFSGSNTLAQVGWHSENSGGSTQKVGLLAPNELGIHDMSGNVFEWCYDWWGLYPQTPQTDPRGATDEIFGRINRGGSWKSPQSYCRVAERPYAAPIERTNSTGFRIWLPVSAIPGGTGFEVCF